MHAVQMHTVVHTPRLGIFELTAGYRRGGFRGGSTRFVRAPLLIRLTCIQESLEMLSIPAEFLLTDFFASLKQLASDIQIVHTSKQIMSFVYMY